MDISSKPIAMAYVPWQKWRDIYPPQKALQQGTIFEELDLPFTGRAPTSENMPLNHRNRMQQGGFRHE